MGSSPFTGSHELKLIQNTIVEVIVMGNRKGLLPVQAFDEINVSNARVETPQKTEVTMKMSKDMKKALKALQKGKKHGR